MGGSLVVGGDGELVDGSFFPASGGNGGSDDLLRRRVVDVGHGMMLREIVSFFPCRAHADDRIGNGDECDMSHYATFDLFPRKFDVLDDGLPESVTLDVEVGIVVLEVVLIHGFDAFELSRHLAACGIDGLPHFAQLVDVLVVDTPEDRCRRRDDGHGVVHLSQKGAMFVGIHVEDVVGKLSIVRLNSELWPFRSLTNCSSSVLVLSGKEHNARNSNERKEDRHFLYILKRRGSGGKREAKTILKRL